MIGNDIVDLQHAAKTSNWKRPRFLNKIFTPEEQHIILNSTDQNKTVWLLWSMKEAAYKIYVRQFRERFFNPKRLVCELNEDLKGLVKIDGNIYFTESISTEDYVHTIASISELDTIRSSCFKMKNRSTKFHSKFCRNEMLQTYSTLKKLELSKLCVQKDTLNIPFLFYNSRKLSDILSIAHHGHYGAYAIV